MPLTADSFDHSAIVIPGITLPDDPELARQAVIDKVDAARRDPRPAVPHAEVMRQVRVRLDSAAPRR